MEDWRTLYQQKLTTAEEAVKHIKSGDRVVVTHATGEPILLTDAMVANAEQYENVEVVHMVAMARPNTACPKIPSTSATTACSWAAAPVRP